MLGNVQPDGMATWPVFQPGVIVVLTQIRQSKGQNVLLVFTSGPITSAIGYALDTLRRT